MILPAYCARYTRPWRQICWSWACMQAGNSVYTGLRSQSSATDALRSASECHGANSRVFRCYHAQDASKWQKNSRFLIITLWGTRVPTTYRTRTIKRPLPRYLNSIRKQPHKLLYDTGATRLVALVSPPPCTPSISTMCASCTSGLEPRASR
jgi:hypothetical protein